VQRFRVFTVPDGFKNRARVFVTGQKKAHHRSRRNFGGIPAGVQIFLGASEISA
jgi:hypothetical protein